MEHEAEAQKECVWQSLMADSVAKAREQAAQQEVAGVLPASVEVVAVGDPDIQTKVQSARLLTSAVQMSQEERVTFWFC